MTSPNSQPAPDTEVSQAASLVYWTSVPATVAGMLGGFPQLSRIDLRGSTNFLGKLRRLYKSPVQSSPERISVVRGVDCGAGIGRVTAGFLSRVCDIVDVVEPVRKFANEVRDAKLLGDGEVGKVYVTGLEDWVPEEQYDLIWNQWCLGHLNDQQLVDHFGTCARSVKRDGWIVVKENMSTNQEGNNIFNETDSSVTRTDTKFRKLFEEAGLQILKTELQKGFPKGLYPVRFYALRPLVE